ncbi:MAG: sensor histidine kinase, partial [Rhizobiaceae bacterium]
WTRALDRRTDDGGIVCIRSDVTDMVNQQDENARISSDLDRASDQLDEALNNMVQGLCMFDPDRRLILCNRQYLKMYGFSAEVVKPGIVMADIMRYSISLGNYREEDAQKALATRNDKKNLSERTVIKQYLADGRVIAVLNEPMSNGGTIATYEDITKLETHEAKLIAYTDKLERSNRELQDFAYVASHDLQEPLRKIEAFSDRLMQKYSDRLPEDGLMYVDRMQNAARRMRQLINDLLGYSRVTTKAKPFVKVDLNEIVEGVLSDLQVRIQECSATIEFADLPSIDADATQMRQLIQNLLSNALKFCKPDVAPVVKIKSEPFTHFTDNGLPFDFVRITLADNGIGFDNQYKDQIFAIFQRLHGRMEYEGTGIGLATCRKIIERHQGMIDANGVPDVGATFTVELPVTQTKTEDD